MVSSSRLGPSQQRSCAHRNSNYLCSYIYDSRVFVPDACNVLMNERLYFVGVFSGVVILVLQKSLYSPQAQHTAQPQCILSTVSMRWLCATGEA